MPKTTRIAIGLTLAAAPIFAGVMRTHETIGSSQSIVQPGASAIGVKTIAQGIFENQGNGTGKVVNGVNLFTGQASFSINLGGISARGVSFPIVLGYNGGTKASMDNDNEKAPTSWVGLGFNLSIPFVAVNHKGTYASFDDVIYCNLGPYGGGQILMDSARTRYFLSTSPYIKIAFDTATSGEYSGQFTKWVFTFPDGKKMMFGQDSNAQRYVQYNKGSIKASPFSYVPSQKYVYRWDLRSFYDTIPGKPPRNVLTFEYDPYLVQASSGKWYTGESYIKKIRWMEGSTEVERYEFATAPKNSAEYVGYESNEVRDDQKIFETRRLDSLKCVKQGTLTRLYKFDWSSHRKNLLDSVGILDSIRVFYPKPLSPGVYVRDSGWTFTYDAYRFYCITNVTYPSSRKDTYTYNPMNFNGTAGAQDVQDYVLKRADGTSDIPLPTDTAKLSKWKVEANCDERFCFSIVRDGDTDYLTGENGITQKLYVEVKRNAGNYFDARATDNGDLVTVRLELGDSNTLADEWKVIPSGNYFLAYSEHSGLVKLYEYDGIKWEDKTSASFTGDPRWTGNTFGGAIKVFASGNYFLIQKTNLPSKVIVAIRKATGWTTLNRSPSSCDFTNKGNYGDSIRNTSSGDCLEWARSSLTLTPSSNFFLVLDSLSGVFCAYALKKDGASFQEISFKFGFYTASGPHKPGYPMNWEQPIQSISSGGDYFIIQCSRINSSYNRELIPFYFDGDSLLIMGTYGTLGSLVTRQVFPSQDYFIVVGGGASNSDIKFFQKIFVDGAPYLSDPILIRSDYNPAWPVQVRTHPNAFTVEYYGDTSGIGRRPKWNGSSTDYQTFLYQVNRKFANGFKDRTSQLRLNGTSLFDVSFSPSDNMLVAANGSNGSNLCNENINAGPCTVNFYSARFHPRDTNTFIDAANDRFLIAGNGAWHPLKQSQFVTSGAARMGAQITLDTTGSQKRARSRIFQYDGKGFTVPDSQFVVVGVTSYSGLADEDRNKIKFNFFYAPNGSGGSSLGQVEFNSHTLSPQFEFVDVKQVKSNGSGLGMSRSFFNLDHASNTLMGKSMLLIGSEKYVLNMNGTVDTTLLMTTISEPYRNPAWPKTLYVTHPKASYSRILAKNQSRMSDTAYYFNFCDTNGVPRFVLQNNRPEKIILSQSLFDSLGFTKQSSTYRLKGQPDTSNLKTYSANTVYKWDSTIASSKSVFKGYFFQEDSIWRQSDPTLSDADLINGKAPVFNSTTDWLPATKITIRDTDNYFQVLESKAVKSKVSGPLGENYTSMFYEGLRSDPVAVVQNAKLSNCAILMGENGNAVLPDANYMDFQKKWAIAGSGFYFDLAHTGKYGIRVSDNYGPTINLTLKDAREVGYGFKVSAWMYSDTGTPVLMIERRRSDGVLIDTIQGTPVAGTASIKKVWQRWEATVSNSRLISNNLFNGNNDYLRIWVGTGSPAGQSGKIVFVDDIVCVPSSAVFNLTTYDKLGPPRSSTDNQHQTLHYDLDYKGRVSAVRDSRFRIYGQTAMHKMGEN